jgi:hypothetical protein
VFDSAAPKVTWNGVLLRVPAPLAVVTVITPETAIGGTLTLIRVSAELTFGPGAVTPPNCTVTGGANPLPLIVTRVPTGPLVGLKLVIDGAALTAALATGPIDANRPIARATAIPRDLMVRPPRTRH